MLGETLQFNVQRGEFVQVLNVGGNHWIMVTSIGCGDSEDILVYDSLPSGHLSRRTKEQIAVILCPNNNSVKLPSVQMQEGVATVVYLQLLLLRLSRLYVMEKILRF